MFVNFLADLAEVTYPIQVYQGNLNDGIAFELDAIAAAAFFQEESLNIKNIISCKNQFY